MRTSTVRTASLCDCLTDRKGNNNNNNNNNNNRYDGAPAVLDVVRVPLNIAPGDYVLGFR